jgi:anti-sigma B factor antagonist
MHLEHPSRLFTVDDEGDAAVVRFTGFAVELTEDNAAALCGLLGPVADQWGRRTLVLDFSNVTFASSVGLGAVLRLYKTTQAAGVSLCLRGVTEAVYDLFDVTRLTTFLDVRRAAPPRESAAPAG